MNGQQLKEQNGHCYAKCVKCKEVFPVPNQEVETWPGGHKGCKTGFLHHHHSISPSLCSNCATLSGPGAQKIVQGEFSRGAPEDLEDPVEDLKELEPEALEEPVEEVKTAEPIKTPEETMKEVIKVFDDPALNKAWEEEHPELKDQVKEVDSKNFLPDPSKNCYTLLHIHPDPDKDIDQALKEIAKDLEASPDQLKAASMPCGQPIPSVNMLVQKMMKKKDWPCACGNPRHFYIKFSRST